MSKSKDAITLKLTRKGELTELTVHITHPMREGDENYLRADNPASPFFLQTLTISLNDRPALDGQLSPALAHNPSFSFFFNNLHAGDKFVVFARDNRNSEFTAEISFES